MLHETRPDVLHITTPPASHLPIALQALELIKSEAGPQNVEITLGFVGVHASSYPINLIYLWNGGSEEGVVQVQLKRGSHVRVEDLKERLRKRFAEQLPKCLKRSRRLSRDRQRTARLHRPSKFA